MSRAKRNVLATIAMAAALPEFLRKKYNDNPPKSIKILITKLKQASDESFNMWPGDIDMKTLGLITKRLKQFENAHIENREVDLIVYTTMTLGMLNDITDILKDSTRISKLQTLINAVFALHKYFDRNLDKFNIYDKANAMVRSWQTLET